MVVLGVIRHQRLPSTKGMLGPVQSPQTVALGHAFFPQVMALFELFHPLCRILGASEPPFFLSLLLPSN